jgi:hypothetical protein
MQNNTIIFESLFNRNFSNPENTDFLKEFTAKHPYFSPAQFYLLLQLNNGTDLFEQQAVKTNILFNNPYWLNFQLQQTISPAQVQQTSTIPAIKPVEPLLAADSYGETTDDLPDNTDASEEMEQEIEPMKIELKMPVEKAKLDETMLFEPMHVVDYFASQGIKLTEEVQAGDKLGKQLKSFTEWLKTMKKVHVENDAGSIDQPDDGIQIMAESSNTEAVVLTESMAEVFAKQGKMSKASEVYQKLSLLNPSKSAYFAAKLENLKGI